MEIGASYKLEDPSKWFTHDLNCMRLVQRCAAIDVREVAVELRSGGYASTIVAMRCSSAAAGSAHLPV